MTMAATASERAIPCDRNAGIGEVPYVACATRGNEAGADSQLLMLSDVTILRHSRERIAGVKGRLNTSTRAVQMLHSLY